MCVDTVLLNTDLASVTGVLRCNACQDGRGEEPGDSRLAGESNVPTTK